MSNNFNFYDLAKLSKPTPYFLSKATPVFPTSAEDWKERERQKSIIKLYNPKSGSWEEYDSEEAATEARRKDSSLLTEWEYNHKPGEGKNSPGRTRFLEEMGISITDNMSPASIYQKAIELSNSWETNPNIRRDYGHVDEYKKLFARTSLLNGGLSEKDILEMLSDLKDKTYNIPYKNIKFFDKEDEKAYRQYAKDPTLITGYGEVSDLALQIYEYALDLFNQRHPSMSSDDFYKGAYFLGKHDAKTDIDLYRANPDLWTSDKGGLRRPYFTEEFKDVLSEDAANSLIKVIRYPGSSTPYGVFAVNNKDRELYEIRPLKEEDFNIKGLHIAGSHLRNIILGLPIDGFESHSRYLREIPLFLQDLDFDILSADAKSDFQKYNGDNSDPYYFMQVALTDIVGENAFNKYMIKKGSTDNFRPVTNEEFAYLAKLNSLFKELMKLALKEYTLEYYQDLDRRMEESMLPKSDKEDRERLNRDYLKYAKMGDSTFLKIKGYVKVATPGLQDLDQDLSRWVRSWKVVDDSEFEKGVGTKGDREGSEVVNELRNAIHDVLDTFSNQESEAVKEQFKNVDIEKDKDWLEQLIDFTPEKFDKLADDIFPYYSKEDNLGLTDREKLDWYLHYLSDINRFGGRKAQLMLTERLTNKSYEKQGFWSRTFNTMDKIGATAVSVGADFVNLIGGIGAMIVMPAQGALSLDSTAAQGLADAWDWTLNNELATWARQLEATLKYIPSLQEEYIAKGIEASPIHSEYGKEGFGDMWAVHLPNALAVSGYMLGSWGVMKAINGGFRAISNVNKAIRLINNLGITATRASLLQGTKATQVGNMLENLNRLAPGKISGGFEHVANLLAPYVSTLSTDIGYALTSYLTSYRLAYNNVYDLNGELRDEFKEYIRGAVLDLLDREFDYSKPIDNEKFNNRYLALEKEYADKYMDNAVKMAEALAALTYILTLIPDLALWTKTKAMLLNERSYAAMQSASLSLPKKVQGLLGANVERASFIKEIYEEAGKYTVRASNVTRGEITSKYLLAFKAGFMSNYLQDWGVAIGEEYHKGMLEDYLSKAFSGDINDAIKVDYGLTTDYFMKGINSAMFSPTSIRDGLYGGMVGFITVKPEINGGNILSRVDANGNHASIAKSLWSNINFHWAPWEIIRGTSKEVRRENSSREIAARAVQSWMNGTGKIYFDSVGAGLANAESLSEAVKKGDINALLEKQEESIVNDLIVLDALALYDPETYGPMLQAIRERAGRTLITLEEVKRIKQLREKINSALAKSANANGDEESKKNEYDKIIKGFINDGTLTKEDYALIQDLKAGLKEGTDIEIRDYLNNIVDNALVANKILDNMERYQYKASLKFGETADPLLKRGYVTLLATRDIAKYMHEVTKNKVDEMENYMKRSITPSLRFANMKEEDVALLVEALVNYNGDAKVLEGVLEALDNNHEVGARSATLIQKVLELKVKEKKKAETDYRNANDKNTSKKKAELVKRLKKEIKALKFEKKFALYKEKYLRRQVELLKQQKELKLPNTLTAEDILSLPENARAYLLDKYNQKPTKIGVKFQELSNEQKAEIKRMLTALENGDFNNSKYLDLVIAREAYRRFSERLKGIELAEFDNNIVTMALQMRVKYIGEMYKKEFTGFFDSINKDALGNTITNPDDLYELVIGRFEAELRKEQDLAKQSGDDSRVLGLYSALKERRTYKDNDDSEDNKARKALDAAFKKYEERQKEVVDFMKRFRRNAKGMYESLFNAIELTLNHAIKFNTPLKTAILTVIDKLGLKENEEFTKQFLADYLSTTNNANYKSVEDALSKLKDDALAKLNLEEALNILSPLQEKVLKFLELEEENIEKAKAKNNTLAVEESNTLKEIEKRKKAIKELSEIVKEPKLNLLDLYEIATKAFGVLFPNLDAQYRDDVLELAAELLKEFIEELKKELKDDDYEKPAKDFTTKFEEFAKNKKDNSISKTKYLDIVSVAAACLSNVLEGKITIQAETDSSSSSSTSVFSRYDAILPTDTSEDPIIQKALEFINDKFKPVFTGSKGIQFNKNTHYVLVVNKSVLEAAEKEDNFNKGVNDPVFIAVEVDHKNTSDVNITTEIDGKHYVLVGVLPASTVQTDTKLARDLISNEYNSNGYLIIKEGNDALEVYASMHTKSVVSEGEAPLVLEDVSFVLDHTFKKVTMEDGRTELTVNIDPARNDTKDAELTTQRTIYVTPIQDTVKEAEVVEVELEDGIKITARLEGMHITDENVWIPTFNSRTQGFFNILQYLWDTYNQSQDKKTLLEKWNNNNLGINNLGRLYDKDAPNKNEARLEVLTLYISLSAGYYFRILENKGNLYLSIFRMENAGSKLLGSVPLANLLSDKAAICSTAFTKLLNLKDADNNPIMKWLVNFGNFESTDKNAAYADENKAYRKLAVEDRVLNYLPVKETKLLQVEPILSRASKVNLSNVKATLELTDNKQLLNPEEVALNIQTLVNHVFTDPQNTVRAILNFFADTYKKIENDLEKTLYNPFILWRRKGYKIYDPRNERDKQTLLAFTVGNAVDLSVRWFFDPTQRKNKSRETALEKIRKLVTSPANSTLLLTENDLNILVDGLFDLEKYFADKGWYIISNGIYINDTILTGSNNIQGELDLLAVDVDTNLIHLIDIKTSGTRINHIEEHPDYIALLSRYRDDINFYLKKSGVLYLIDKDNLHIFNLVTNISADDFEVKIGTRDKNNNPISYDINKKKKNLNNSVLQEPMNRIKGRTTERDPVFYAVDVPYDRFLSGVRLSRRTLPSADSQKITLEKDSVEKVYNIIERLIEKINDANKAYMLFGECPSATTIYEPFEGKISVELMQELKNLSDHEVAFFKYEVFRLFTEHALNTMSLRNSKNSPTTIDDVVDSKPEDTPKDNAPIIDYTTALLLAGEINLEDPNGPARNVCLDNFEIVNGGLNITVKLSSGEDHTFLLPMTLTGDPLDALTSYKDALKSIEDIEPDLLMDLSTSACNVIVGELTRLLKQLGRTLKETKDDGKKKLGEHLLNVDLLQQRLVLCR